MFFDLSARHLERVVPMHVFDEENLTRLIRDIGCHTDNRTWRRIVPGRHHELFA